MRHVVVGMLCAGSMLALSACNKGGGRSDEEVARALKEINVIDESGLNSVMLNAGDPNEAVAYFARTLKENPERTDLKRGLAVSLVRAKKNSEGAAAWKAVAESPDATNDDRVEYADALIRNNQWPDAEAVLATIPPTHETFKRYRLEAMIADSHKDWKKADSFYEIAIGLTTTPSNVLNNWGFSKLSRGDYRGAEKLFNDALVHDASLFTAKNNLVLARAAQRNYELPAVPMTQIERAELLYTMALSAVKQGDIQTGKSLLNNAIETHPQHFDSAVRALAAIENGQTPT